MHPEQLHFVTINSYLSSPPWAPCHTTANTSLFLLNCRRRAVTLAALRAFALTVIWPNAASGSACLHDVSPTTATVLQNVAGAPIRGTRESAAVKGEKSRAHARAGRHDRKMLWL